MVISQNSRTHFLGVPEIILMKTDVLRVVPKNGSFYMEPVLGVRELS